MQIEVKNLSFKYNNEMEDILKNVSFSVEKGEWISIVGHNGSGKSTLARLLVGIEETDRGEVLIDGIKLTEESSYEIRKDIGIVFQNPDNHFVAANIEDDIAFGLENLEIAHSDMQDLIDYSLDAVSMTHLKDRMPSELSGGEKQRAAIAGILAMNPNILIFDEATSMLDPIGRSEVISLIKELHKRGKTIIMITHDMDEAALSDRTIVLMNGEIIKDDLTINVMNDIETLRKSRLEMPSELYLYHKLKLNGYKNEEVLNALWNLALKK